MGRSLAWGMRGSGGRPAVIGLCLALIAVFSGARPSQSEAAQTLSADDPLVLAYSTYFGSPSSEAANDIAVDATGAAYIAGIAGDGPGGAHHEAFVAKISPAGDELVYLKRFGGSGLESAEAIAVDATGAAYVGGHTRSSDLPTVGGVDGYSGGQDAFVAKLSPSGDTFEYLTYLGGSGDEFLYDLAVDAGGSAYVTGYSGSPDFELENPIQAGNPNDVQTDAFVTKLNPSGTDLAYSTHLGGFGRDQGAGIAVDLTGAAYVTGSSGAGFPTVNPIQGHSADYDITVSKLNPGGTALVYSTYLGGGSVDMGVEIGVDATGAAYVVGQTQSTNMPLASPAYSGPNGQLNGYAAKLNPAGDSFVYATYLPGGAPQGMALDATGAVHVAGGTFLFGPGPPLVNAYEGAQLGSDAYVQRIAPGGALLEYSSHLGGNDRDMALGVATDTVGASYVTGVTNSTDFDLVNPIQGSCVGLMASDGFVAKLQAGIPAPAEPAPDTTILDAPKNKTKHKKATFAFDDTPYCQERPTSFECSLDGRSFESCTSPLTVRVRRGRHTFEVRAEASTAADPTPATDTWKVKKKKKKGKKKKKKVGSGLYGR